MNKIQVNCTSCKQNFTKQKFINHIPNCNNNIKNIDSYLLFVSAQGLSKYWMFISIPIDFTLFNLSDFLQDIWLKCCNHVSSFEINGKDYVYPKQCDVGNYSFRRTKKSSFSEKIKNVIKLKDKFKYNYDMGSTTEIEICVVLQYKKEIETINLLARNESPIIKCYNCKKDAVNICPMCHECVCNNCVRCVSHECMEDEDDELLIKISNSPRSGQCAYE